MARQRTRKVIDATVEIAAPAQAVWRAISDPRELERWFPLRRASHPARAARSSCPGARRGREPRASTPGSRTPPAHARLPRARGRLDGRVHARGAWREDGAAPRALRLREGRRLEDELFGGTERGWRYELRSLRHYLERHAGRDRVVAWPRASVRGRRPRSGDACSGRKASYPRGADRGTRRRRPLRDGLHGRRAGGDGGGQRSAIRVRGDGERAERRASRACARTRPPGRAAGRACRGPVRLDLGSAAHGRRGARREVAAPPGRARGEGALTPRQPLRASWLSSPLSRPRPGTTPSSGGPAPARPFGFIPRQTSEPLRSNTSIMSSGEETWAPAMGPIPTGPPPGRPDGGPPTLMPPPRLADLPFRIAMSRSACSGAPR